MYQTSLSHFHDTALNRPALVLEFGNNTVASHLLANQATTVQINPSPAQYIIQLCYCHEFSFGADRIQPSQAKSLDLESTGRDGNEGHHSMSREKDAELCMCFSE